MQLRHPWTLGLSLLCLALPAAAQEAPVGPALDHTPVVHATPGEPLTLTATIHSGNGVFQPIVSFRHVGEAAWVKVPLLPSGGDLYSATIPGASLGSDIEYYLEAYDNDGNGPARAGSADVPFRISVGGGAAPFVSTAARETSAQTAVQPPAPAPSAEAKKQTGVDGRTIGGVAALAVGVVGGVVCGYGVYQRSAAVTNANSASAAVRPQYYPEISEFTAVGIGGGVVAVAAIATGVYLLASGSKDEAPAASPSGGLSVAPLPGGAVAAFSGSW